VETRTPAASSTATAKRYTDTAGDKSARQRSRSKSRQKIEACSGLTKLTAITSTPWPKEYIARQLIWRSVTAKRRCSEHQSEVRLVCLNQSKNFNGIEKTFGGRRYIEYPLPRDFIAEVMIGSAAPRDAEANVERLLKDHGYLGVPITRSLKVPAAAVPAFSG
jgi:hypothetical protein